jgi:hypothetical protein
MTEPKKCPVCPRVRRDDRPLCNTHIRRVGGSVLERYFTLRRAASRSQMATAPVHARLVGIQNQMIINATAWEQIRATGYKPAWNAAGERWEDPRERAIDILERAISTHAFGLDQDNDRAVIERIANELCPPEPR